MPRTLLHVATAALLALVAAKPNTDAVKSIALVERGGRVVATAFCIDKSGVFVTNRTAVHGELRKDGKGGLLLILNAGTPRQRSVWADIELEDPELDVALLRASVDLDARRLPEGTYVPLDLAVGMGDADDVSVIGFRAGAVQKPKQGPYPTAVMTPSRIGRLERGVEMVHFFHLTKPLEPGHAGAPVLGEDGHVIGIIVSSEKGSDFDRAVPAARLRELLALPLVEFLPAPVARSELGKPHTFEVVVRSFERLVGNLAAAKTQTMELEFPSADGDLLGSQSEAQTTAPGDAIYKITVIVPVPKDDATEVACKLVLKRDGEVVAEMDGTIPVFEKSDDPKRP